MRSLITDKHIRSAAVLGLLLCSMTYAGAWQRANAQGLPSLVDVLATIPADALSVDISAFALNDQPHASVRYMRAESAYVSFDRVVSVEREYTNMYRWSGSSWQKVLDGYQYAQSFYSASPLATASAIATPDPIGLTGDSPTPETALVFFGVQPLIRQPFDESRMPDLVALTMRYFLGPSGLQHPFPSLAILLPTADGFATVYATDFHVRGKVRDVYRFGDSLHVLADAYLPRNGACCPNGTEFLHLLWRSGTLVQVERCIRPNPHVTSCAEP